jgi:cephalosporin-C deacetylase
VTGGSQGGALSLAVAALRNDIALCMADVPSNAWLDKRVFDRAGGANSISEYLRKHPDMLERVSETLSTFDLINLAERITCPTLVSAGFRDPICPVENVYAAYNKIPAEKEIVVYPFGEHDGGGPFHNERRLEFLRQHLING